MLQITNGTFGYTPDTPIFSNISFSVEKGEILSLIGPNGIGKSTLLKCLMGLMPLSRGSITIDGIDTATLSARELAKKIAYVPQSFANVGLSSITVMNSVLMGRFPYARNSYAKEDYEKTFRILQQIGLESKAFQNINELSGGQRQLAFIARALVQGAGIILLDEPTSSLDLNKKLSVLKLIEEIAHEKNISIIMTMHDINLASMFSDTMLMLQNKEIFAYGDAQQVITKPNIDKVFQVNTKIVEDEGCKYVILKKD